MAKQTHPKILTANDLRDGDSVFLSAQGWVSDLCEALVAEDAAAADILAARGEEAEAANLIVGPYLVDVAPSATGPRPILRREAIRASRRPTIAVGNAPQAAAA